jgi:hypothetical protein
VTAPVRARFADFEVLLVTVLQDLAGGEDHCDTETPTDLIDRLPFIRARKIDGFRDRLTDQPIADVDCFAPDRSARALADEVFERLMRQVPPHPAIDSVVCSEAPRELPWGDGRIRRWTASYGFSLRRTRIPLL